MGQNGLHNGLIRGLESGHKKGFVGGLRKGFSKGFTNGVHSQNFPIQDPALLQGLKKPVAYGLADFWTQPDGITTTLTDIANTGRTLTCNYGGSIRPVPTPFGALGTKNSMYYPNTQSYFTTSTDVPFVSEYSFVMVVKLNGTTNARALLIEDNINVGGLDLMVENANNRLKNTFYGGQSGAMTNSQYRTSLPPNVMSDWLIISGVMKLDISLGAGSEQNIWINGALQKDFVSSTFNVVTPTMVAKQIIVGNLSTSSPANALGFEFGAFSLFDYALNSEERFRIENYFRKYYGYNF